MENILDFVHLMIHRHLDPASIAIDATMGNGHDTLMLSKHADEVFAFDVQKSALEATRQRLETHGRNNVRLIQDSHANMYVYVAGGVSVIVFNFGYLPGGDKTLTTTKAASLDAVKQSLELLKEGGLLALTFYPGHEEGAKEAALIEPYLATLDPHHFSVLNYRFINRRNSPYSIFVKKH